MAQVATILCPEDFSRPVHASIYRILQEMIADKTPIDPVAVNDALKRSGEQPDIWEGLVYFGSCCEVAGFVGDILYHARKIKCQSMLRKHEITAHEWADRTKSPDADPEALRGWLQEQLQTLTIETGTTLSHISECLTRQFDRIVAHKDIEGLEGYSTGFSRLDNMTGGYGKPLFVILKARRKTGKTQNIIGPLYNCVNAGMAALVISMDTGEQITIPRLIAYSSGINSFRVNKPSDDDWNAMAEAFAWWHDKPVWLHQLSGCRVSQIEAYAKSIIAKGLRLGIIIIDFAEKLRPERHGQQREQELATMGIDLARIKEELGTTVLLLSQTNKDGGERWSQSLGDNSDLILKWELDDPDNKSTHGTAKLIVEGNRVGPAGSIDCVYDFGTSRIRESYLDHSDPNYPARWPWWYTGPAEVTE